VSFEHLGKEATVRRHQCLVELKSSNVLNSTRLILNKGEGNRQKKKPGHDTKDFGEISQA
jgi:hypothetical protein